MVSSCSEVNADMDQDQIPPVEMEVDEPRLSQIPPVETAEEAPVLNAAGRVARKRRPTWKVLEQLPAPATPVLDIQVQAAPLDPNPIPATPLLDVPATAWNVVHTTDQNAFGLYREFSTFPTHDPDDILTVADLAESQPPPTVVDAPMPSSRLSVPALAPTGPDSNSNGPFANSSIFGLLNWMWTGSPLKSLKECIELFRFLQSDAFQKEDIIGVDFVKETAKLDEYMGFQSKGSNEAPLTSLKDGWQESDITIQVPDGSEHINESDIPTFVIPGLHHRSLTAVIRSVFEDPTSRRFHYTPFKSFWKNSKDSDSPARRIHDELYSSDAMIEAHTKLQQSPPEPGCGLERVVASLMFWSDSTHLANFGTASLWPLYLFFGNQSKTLRCKPRTASCHHIAYIPKVDITS